MDEKDLPGYARRLIQSQVDESDYDRWITATYNRFFETSVVGQKQSPGPTSPVEKTLLPSPRENKGG
jgi:hypothetical protein